MKMALMESGLCDATVIGCNIKNFTFQIFVCVPKIINEYCTWLYDVIAIA